MQSSTRPCVVSLALITMLGIPACSSDTPATPCGNYARSDLLWDVAYGAPVSLLSATAARWLLPATASYGRTPEPSPTDEELFALAARTNGVVAVAGVDAILFSADGHTWSVTASGD